MRVYTITILEEEDSLGPLEVHMQGPNRSFPMSFEADSIIGALDNLKNAIIRSDIRWQGIPD